MFSLDRGWLRPRSGAPSVWLVGLAWFFLWRLPVEAWGGDPMLQAILPFGARGEGAQP